MPKVVITLPAYRASLTVAKTVADVPAELAEHMILVDDASPDDTVERARELGLKVYVHTENRGYGANLKTCYLKALEGAADIVVVLHPDYQYDPKAVPLLIAPILAGDADMTFGSRFAGIGDPLSQGMPLYRFLGNRILTIIQNAMLGTRFTEMHSGMRAYRRETLLSLPFLGYSDDFLFESQILVDAVARKYRVIEVPIPTRYEMESSSLHLKGLFRYTWSTITYTAKRTARWGRRGKRWPTPQRSGAAPRPVASETTPSDVSLSAQVGTAIVEGVLQRLQAYLLPGNTVAVVAGSDKLLEQLTLASEWQRTSEPSGSADAVVLIHGGRAEGAAQVAAANVPTLNDEGILAIVVPHSASPAQMASALDEKGLRLIDWTPIGKLVPRWTLALVRPKSL